MDLSRVYYPTESDLCQTTNQVLNAISNHKCSERYFKSSQLALIAKNGQLLLVVHAVIGNITDTTLMNPILLGDKKYYAGFENPAYCVSGNNSFAFNLPYLPWNKPNSAQDPKVKLGFVVGNFSGSHLRVDLLNKNEEVVQRHPYPDETITPQLTGVDNGRWVAVVAVYNNNALSFVEPTPDTDTESYILGYVESHIAQQKIQSNKYSGLPRPAKWNPNVNSWWNNDNNNNNNGSNSPHAEFYIAVTPLQNDFAMKNLLNEASWQYLPRNQKKWTLESNQKSEFARLSNYSNYMSSDVKTNQSGNLVCVQFKHGQAEQAPIFDPTGPGTQLPLSMRDNQPEPRFIPPVNQTSGSPSSSMPASSKIQQVTYYYAKHQNLQFYPKGLGISQEMDTSMTLTDVKQFLKSDTKTVYYKFVNKSRSGWASETSRLSDILVPEQSGRSTQLTFWIVLNE